MPKSQLLRYLIIGGTAYLIEMGSIYFMKKELNFSSIKAVAISFWIGFIAAFLLQKLVTFKNYEKKLHIILKQLIIYSILVIFNYFSTLLIVKLFSTHISVYILRTAVIIILTTVNFYIYKRIFNNPNEGIIKK